jgi:ribonuclease G
LRRELLISAGPGEWRAALIEDGAAAELYIERGDAPPPGSIFVGRVLRLLPGLDAALVEIGLERPGFLPLRRGEKRPEEGARIVAQLRREAQQDKGALLSTRIPPAVGASELAALLDGAARIEPPAQLWPPAGFAGALALRLPAIPDEIVADEAAIVRELRQAFAGVEVAQRRAEEWTVDLDGLYETALSPSLALSGGGSMHIAETRAAVLVDVDTGTPEAGSLERAALAINLIAAAAIARQLRLRQLGGGIVIDFAALEGRGPREQVRQAMTAALAGDPAEPQVLGWTRLGHLELVRPRRGRPLSEAMLEAGTGRKNAVALAFEALRVLQREARMNPAANWRLTVAPAIEAALRGPAAAGLKSLEQRLGRSITIAVTPAGEAQPFDIGPV